MKKKQLKGFHPLANIPASQLKALSETSDQMMRSILLEDRQRTLDTVTRHIQKMLKAESCAISLVPDNARDVLVVESSYTDKFKEICNSRNTHIKIQSVKGKGLTGHIADKGKVVNMSLSEMQASEYWAKTPPKHLESETCFSLLAIPLKDRKGRLLGLLKAENKKDAEGLSNKDTNFTTVDQFIARVLANKVVIVLENLRAHNVLRGLIRDTQSDENYNLILGKILHRAVTFMRADRGDLALWSEQKRDLIIASVWGETVNTVAQLGHPVPTPSIIRSAWKKTSRPLLVFRKVKQRKDYYEINSQTKSEAAIRLNLDGRAIGVLNLESFYSEGFDKKDLESLQLLSNYVSIAVRMASKHTLFHPTPLRTISEIPPEFSADWSEKNLHFIFKAIKAAGFESARIFKYDGDRKLFTCVGSFERGREDSLRGKSSGIEENPYANDMVETYLNNKRARIYDPTDPLSFGEDPSAVAFGKPEDLPWAAAPLIVDNELYGQITVDNGWSRKPITEESLEYLNLIAVQISRSLTQRRVSQLTTLMETIPDYIYFKDLESRYLRISHSMVNYFHLKDSKEAEGKTDFDYFDHEYAQRKFADEQHILATGQPIKDLEEPDILQKGDKGWVSTTKMPLKTADGTIIGTFGISRDITHRKRNQLELEHANRALVESQEKLKKANSRLDMQLERASGIAHFGFWEWDIYEGENVKIKATDEVYRIFGLTPQQEGVKFRDFRALVHPDDVHIWNEIFSRAALAKPFLPFEIRLRFPDGTIKNLYAKSEVGKVDDSGRPMTIIGLVQDVTERKKDEMRAKELELLAIRGFQHMIPGLADEAGSCLEFAHRDNSFETAMAKAGYFIFMIRHKADEVRSLRYDESRFPNYTLGEIWDKAWPIALDLILTRRGDLKIVYGTGTDGKMQVSGALYTAAVNIFSNARYHGTPPFVVWCFVEGDQIEVIFADGGPKYPEKGFGECQTQDGLGMEHGVGLPLVRKILEICKGTIRRLNRDEFCARYSNPPTEMKDCLTFFHVVMPV